MGVDNNVNFVMLPATSVTTKKNEGDLELATGKKKVSKTNKFSNFLKKMYMKIVSSEAVRSFVSVFGHVALNVGEKVAMEKVSEVISEKYPENKEVYTAVAKQALSKTSEVAKNMLPASKSIPSELFTILANSLEDYQISALKQEARALREERLQKAMED